MDFIKDNLSTIVVGALVFAVLGLALFRQIRNFRRGKGGCPCGCSGCRVGQKLPAGTDAH
jgi:hypothetical protein